ncbi:unnamed protein product [Linum trigynum]|uniref:Reverse transcriptase zinc-binding domain-containing protein n=1 Tax=Linum trigynum TaxID=586398 RepID=A0AAV2GNG9_9ROSI
MKKLWVQVLKGKYLNHKDGMIVSMKKSNPSSLWKAVLRAMPMMKQATAWSISDGASTGFWTHPWIDHDIILADFLKQDINDQEMNSAVADWVTKEGEWDWSRLNSLLHDKIMSLIAGSDTLIPSSGEDKRIWGIEQDGKLCLKSAYNLDSDFLGRDEDSIWKGIWKWKGPSKIKHFLWLETHNRLMTNKERSKRGLTTNISCPHCNNPEETMEHTLRSCKKIKGVWNRFKASITDQEPNHDFKT